MIYEIINPSDACTMDAPDLEIAAIAVILIGDGKYGLKALDSDQSVPPFIFGGADEWFTQKFGSDFKSTANNVISNRKEDLATTLDSVSLQRERTSVNDIAGRAKSIAESIRSKS